MERLSNTQHLLVDPILERVGETEGRGEKKKGEGRGEEKKGEGRKGGEEGRERVSTTFHRQGEKGTEMLSCNPPQHSVTSLLCSHFNLSYPTPCHTPLPTLMEMPYFLKVLVLMSWWTQCTGR